MSKMTPFRMLTSYKEALETIQKSITPINRTELIQIEKASNRILAKDVVANMSVPPFDRAAMDGYAVRADETIGASSLKPRKLKLTEVLHAGASTNRALDKGECIQVATGSPIPEGADAVVMVEFTERHGSTIDISKPVYPRANISPKGEDIKKGQTILRSGEQILPARIGALAALGKKEVEVYQKPRIAVVSTGTEIQEVGCSLRKGQIYDVNSYTLFSIARRNMAIPMKNKIVPDTVDQLKETIEKLLGYDMIVLSGGSSVGERDLLMKVIQELGTVLFHGIQMKPGKPTLFALVNGKPVFGMPGYPTSCLLNAYLLLVPAVRQMARLPPEAAKTVKVPLAKRIVSSTGRTLFLTVKIENNQAYPVFKQSGAITSMTEADGYIILPVNIDIVEKNQEVTVILFD